LHQWGYTPKVPAKRFVNSATTDEKIWFKKKSRQKIATKLFHGFTVLSQDESISVHDTIVRKKMQDKKRSKAHSHHNDWFTSKDCSFWCINS
jgi:hypothetical protein